MVRKNYHLRQVPHTRYDLNIIYEIFLLEYHKPLVIPSHTWRDFLRDTQFYFISLIWMLTRVISNISQVYLPLYIMDTTDASQVDRVRLRKHIFH